MRWSPDAEGKLLSFGAEGATFEHHQIKRQHGLKSLGSVNPSGRYRLMPRPTRSTVRERAVVGRHAPPPFRTETKVMTLGLSDIQDSFNLGGGDAGAVLLANDLTNSCRSVRVTLIFQQLS
jgi:hypothetical protein